MVTSRAANSLREPSPEWATTVIEYELWSSKSGSWPVLKISLPVVLSKSKSSPSGPDTEYS